MDDFGMGYALGQDSNNGNCCNNGGGMWGGDGSWIFAFLIIALIFGGNNWGGFGGNGNNGANAFLPYAMGMNGAVTRADLCSEFNFNGLENAVRGVQSGLCDGFYAVNTSLLNGFHGVDNAVCQLGYQTQQGFNSVNNAICNLGYNEAQLINGVNTNMMQGFNGVTAGLNGLSTQMASCCCETQRQIERGFCDTNYAQATNTTAIIQNAHNDTDRVLAKLDAMEMSRKDETIAALREKVAKADLAASQAAQNNYIVDTLRPCPQPAYITCNPFTGGYGYGGYPQGQGNCGCGPCGSCCA